MVRKISNVPPLDPVHLAFAKKLESSKDALVQAFMSLMLILSVEANPLDNSQETIDLGPMTRKQIKEAIDAIIREINNKENQ